MRSNDWPKWAAAAALCALGAGCATGEGSSGTIEAPCDLAAWSSYLTAKPKKRVDFPEKTCAFEVPKATSETWRYDTKLHPVYVAYRADGATVRDDPAMSAIAAAVAAQHLGTPLFVDCEIVFVGGRYLLQKSVEKDGVTAEVLVEPTAPDGGGPGVGGTTTTTAPVYAWAPRQFTERVLPGAPPAAGPSAASTSDFEAATKAANDALATYGLGAPAADLSLSLVQRVFLPAASTAPPTSATVPPLAPSTSIVSVPNGFERRELLCTLKTTTGLARVVVAPNAAGTGWAAVKAYRIVVSGDKTFEYEQIPNP